MLRHGISFTMSLINFYCKGLLINAGAKVNARDKNNNTPLHNFVVSRSTDVEKLLDRGADINAKNNQGRTPLHLAANEHFYPTVEELLKYPRIEVNAQDNEGNTPLHLAAAKEVKSSCAEQMIRILLAKGARVNIKNVQDKTVLQVKHESHDNDWYKTSFSKNCNPS